MRIDRAKRAEVLIEALPYIQEYYNKIVVIKYGGNAMLNDELKQQVMSDILLLKLVGVKIVLVHGGGPEINDLLSKVGKVSYKIEGLRVTDAETMDYVQMALAGKVNKSLVNLLETKGGKAMGISGMDGSLIEAVQKSKELGFVGDVTKVNPQPIYDLLEKDYIPVISSIARDKEGNVYNVNADTVAGHIAAAINAECLIFMTDISGIMARPYDSNSLIPVVDLALADKLYKDGVVTGGMIPKMECCVNAVKLGVKKVFILDGRVPHSILLETLTDEGSGTMFIK
ncbi:MAG: acetylglutamate kinase [Christensenellaceae bacterium]|nr:acetylglutamate kinase [Christensenellaceae bacterium]